jgi:hypothetical protein
MKKTVSVIALTAAALLLAGCSKATNEDRTGDVGNGSLPDRTLDATHVDLYRNADGVPTVILFCVEDLRFASTASSTTDGGKANAPSLLRLPEQDAVCTGKPQ